ncbi:MAG: hypothetical protein JSS48_12330, partial [Nitrospira sp.]|nr:hypothetical protein [Nitrospira sp.]
MKLIEAIVKP